MKHFFETSGGYVICVGTGGGTEITKEQYNAILDIIRNKPADTETTAYRLREDLTWEAFQPDPPEPEDIDESEAWEIIFGGGAE